VERDLVERARRGDRESFGILADGSMVRRYNHAQLMVGDSDLAADAVQEALIASWRDLRALRDPDRFDAWLTRILVRTVYRLAKSERRRTDPEALVETFDRPAADVAGDVERRDEIDRGFRRLDPKYRAVLVIHHYLGLSNDEAAEVLGVPSGTVKSRLHRATEALRAELDAGTRLDRSYAEGPVR
jgi:RNA polymerase sigma-70 factor (ECF subfamily)